MFNIYGETTFDPGLSSEVQNMHQPVQCTFCRGIYDLGTVTITNRYVDATVWQTPCCSRTADDRSWKSKPDYRRIKKGSTWKTT